MKEPNLRRTEPAPSSDGVLALFELRPALTVGLPAELTMELRCNCGQIVLRISYATGTPHGTGCPHNHREGCPQAAAVDAALAGTPWGGA